MSAFSNSAASNVIEVDFGVRVQRQTTVDADTVSEMLESDEDIDAIVDAFMRWREDLAIQRTTGQPSKPSTV